ncbi:MAG: type II toxin-antitoxin system PemK/MazF family toxin [Candidatus Hatepunaea meridiana]|nr:type II toxin-antitoxin system PemK/MazF family toxin [Candidatus Hatepunaea meridiana]
MTDIKRGTVLLVNLEPTIGSEQRGKSRPCLVVSPDALNQIFRGIIVCPITDARHIKQSELGLTFLPAGEGGLDKESLVIAFQVRMIDKRRVIRKLGSVGDSFVSEVNESLRAVLDLP